MQGYGNKRQWHVSPLYSGIHQRLLTPRLLKDAVSVLATRIMVST
jgi:hypothetical protein